MPKPNYCVDHKPLTRILNDRELDTIDNPRLLTLKEKTLMYNFNIVHLPGGSTTMVAPDALSRHPIEMPITEKHKDECDQAALAHATYQAEGIQTVTWTKVNQAAAKDQECICLVELIQNGFPELRNEVTEDLRCFWNMRDELYVVDNVPFKGHKMLIPRPLRKLVLEGLHAAHQGVNGMLSNARERLFWPGLDAAIRLIRSQCRQCNENSPSQAAEPAIVSVPPEVPFQQTVTDLCEIEGHNFLVYADRYSGWVEVNKLASKTFPHIRRAMLNWFATYGVPEEMASDGGPPFNAIDYDQFLKDWDIRKRQSSAYYPQSNGRAEVAVKSIKRTLLGNINPLTGQLDTYAATRAIMTHRNTPVQDTGISPAVALFGHTLRDHLPVSKRKLCVEWQHIAMQGKQR